MHLYGNNQCDFTHQKYALGELGFDPISTIMTGAALKNIFGIGAKKRAFKELESTAKGEWISQYPKNFDWNEYLNKKFGGQVRQVYDAQRGKKDSILLKNRIASPEDFAAWHFTTYGLQQGKGTPGPACNPNEKNPASNKYKWCPVDEESGINVFDTDRLAKYYQGKQKSAPTKTARTAPAPTAAPATPQLHPSSFQAPSTQLVAQGPGFDINKLLSIFGQQAQAQTPQQVTVTAPKKNYLMEGAFVVGTGLLVYTLTRGRAGKRRRK